MIPEGKFNILREVRDLQVIDRDGLNCGICDDIEFKEASRGGLDVHCLLIGPGALRKRLPAWWGFSRGGVFPSRIVRVPWSDIETITSRIRLKTPASNYGLLDTDEALRPYLMRIPAL
jgi:sporulation protein YlmC with PRC-barrel domain